MASRPILVADLGWGHWHWQALVGNRTGLAIEGKIKELEHFLSHQARLL